PLRWHHLAVVAWYPQASSDGNELPRLQRFLRDMGQAAGVAASPLFVAADDDPGVLVAAMLGADVTQAREWVAEVLGDLAVDDDNDAWLRETLHVFLS